MWSENCCDILNFWWLTWWKKNHEKRKTRYDLTLEETELDIEFWISIENHCAQLLTRRVTDVVAALNVEKLKHTNSNWNLLQTKTKHKKLMDHKRFLCSISYTHHTQKQNLNTINQKNWQMTKIPKHIWTNILWW